MLFDPAAPLVKDAPLLNAPGPARLFLAGGGLFLIAGALLWWAQGAALVFASPLAALGWCF
jgi:hypothetical protein